MTCPSCRGEDVMTVETSCIDPDDSAETLHFSVCANCDYGINDHTEGECDCPKREEFDDQQAG